MLAFSIKQIPRDMQLLATEKARRNAGGAAARCYPWWLQNPVSATKIVSFFGKEPLRTV
jgi:hypothetical protein